MKLTLRNSKDVERKTLATLGDFNVTIFLKIHLKMTNFHALVLLKIDLLPGTVGFLEWIFKAFLMARFRLYSTLIAKILFHCTIGKKTNMKGNGIIHIKLECFTNFFYSSSKRLSISQFSKKNYDFLDIFSRATAVIFFISFFFI